jgi:hypothetical protein
MVGIGRIFIAENPMDLIIALAVLVMVLAGQLLGETWGSTALCRWYRAKKLIFSQKLLVAALTGFGVYTLITPEISSWPQKILLSLIVVIFIWAVFIKPAVSSSG